MISRSVKRSLIGTRWAPSSTIALPLRANLTTAPYNPKDAGPLPPDHPHSYSKPATTPPNPFESLAADGVSDTSGLSDLKALRRAAAQPRSAPPKPAEPLIEPVLDESVTTLLPLLTAQPPFYIQANIHGFPYLLTAGDTLRVPFLMHGVQPGDILRLNRATIVGSRDYTLKAGATTKGEKARYLDERLFVCRARVVSVESEPERIKLKTKQRMRHVRQIKSKHSYTVLRITEVTVRKPEELDKDIPELD
jgi:large subunit ribosomal protein L21